MKRLKTMSRTASPADRSRQARTMSDVTVSSDGVGRLGGGEADEFLNLVDPCAQKRDRNDGYHGRNTVDGYGI